MRHAFRPRPWPITSGLLLACACAGCSLGPDYARPTLDVPDQHRFLVDAPVATSMPDVAPWWEGFGDPELDTLVREGLDNNRDLRVAIARVDEFAARVSSTRSQRFPQVGYGGNAARARATEVGTPPLPAGASAIAESYGSVLGASWQLDLWGRIRYETEAARADLLSTEQARRGVALTVVSAIVSGYLTLLDLDRQLVVSQETVKGRRASVDLFTLRRQAGAISDFELMQVLAEQEAAIAAVPIVQQAIAQQEDALSILVGRNPGPIVRAKSLQALGLPGVPAGLPADLLERRPDVLQAEEQLAAAHARMQVARALYFPSISLTATGGFASAELGDLFTGPARTWSFIGQLLGPIFAGGAIDAANRQAEARREQSLAVYEGTVQNAFREVADALSAIRSTREVQESYKRRVDSLRKGVELARERYDNGYSDYLEVLDTERNLFSAELALSSASGDMYRARVALYRALGGEWSPDTPPPLGTAAPAPEAVVATGDGP